MCVCVCVCVCVCGVCVCDEWMGEGGESGGGVCLCRGRGVAGGGVGGGGKPGLSSVLKSLVRSAIFESGHQVFLVLDSLEQRQNLD